MGKGTRAFVRGQVDKLLKGENYVLKCCVVENHAHFNKIFKI